MTAVEWLLEQLKINNYIQLSDNAHWVIDEAKEMEKEHLKQAFEESRKANIFEENKPPIYKDFEEWFKNK